MSVLILGYGNRSKSNIIPALKALNKKIYIYGRNPLKTLELCKQTNCMQVKSLDSLPQSVDMICITIPSDVCLGYINQINSDICSKSILYVDTPFFGSFKNLKLLKLQNKFRKTLVTEDWISKPSFEIVKSLALKNNLGELKEIIFNNSGYFYHSLAISRRLFKRKISFAYYKNGNYYFNFGLKKMSIINPKKYEDCSTIYKFKRGIIADRANHEVKIGKCDHVLTRSLSGKSLSYEYSSDLTKNKKIFSFPHSLIEKDTNYENIEKFLSLQKKFTENEIEYSFEEGAYDSLIFNIINKTNFFIDISLRNNSLIYFILKLYGKL